MLESVLAGLLLVGFMLFLAHGQNTSGSDDIEGFGWMLPELDHKGLLRGYVYSGDLSGLEDEIVIYGFEDSIQVCRPGGSCSGTIPNEDNVWVSSYFLSGDTSFQAREVRLYAWKA